MAKLLFSLEGTFLGEFPLDKEKITIGRRPSNDILIDNLAVSGEHAIIKTIGKDAFLEDLGSTNGTLVNRKKIHQHILQHDDVISLSKYQLRYVSDNASDSAVTGTSSASAKQAAVRPAAPPVQQADNTPPVSPASKAQPAKSKEPQIIGRIRVLSGSNIGKELMLDKALTTLGKPGLQVAVISRRHQGYVITHVEGQKHPPVKGKPIGVQAHALNDHDMIELAGVKMEFSLAQG